MAPKYGFKGKSTHQCITNHYIVINYVFCIPKHIIKAVSRILAYKFMTEKSAFKMRFRCISSQLDLACELASANSLTVHQTLLIQQNSPLKIQVFNYMNSRASYLEMQWENQHGEEEMNGGSS
jgi:hypothetical protein